MNNLYWNVYKNLEREFLQLAEVIHIDDKQLNVYSMRIADLLIRTWVEIESISKELYINNGGPKIDQPYFDENCLNFLNREWNLEKKEVMVTGTMFYFQKEELRTIRPLNRANKRGEPAWKRAYQAVKHDRANNLSKGNLEYLIKSLAGLYLLNIYYLNQIFPLKRISSVLDVDPGMGSSIFSVKIYEREPRLESNGYTFDEIDLNKYTYIMQPTQATKDLAPKVLRDFEFSTLEKVIQSFQDENKISVENESDLQEKILDNEKFKDFYTKNKLKFAILSTDDLKLLVEAQNSTKYELVLNKNQYSKTAVLK